MNSAGHCLHGDLKDVPVKSQTAYPAMIMKSAEGNYLQILTQDLPGLGAVVNNDMNSVGNSLHRDVHGQAGNPAMIMDTRFTNRNYLQSQSVMQDIFVEIFV